jgi:hypothetical protein
MWLDKPQIEMRKMLADWLAGPPEERALRAAAE